MSFYGVWQNTENETFIFKVTMMNTRKAEKILAVAIDNRLTFSSHIRKLCKNSFQKNIGFVKNMKPI